MAGTIVRGCRLAGLDLRAARAHRTQWLGCTGDGAALARRPARRTSSPARGSAGRAVASTSRRQARDVHRPHRLGEQRRVVADDTRLASAGNDGTVRIWDPATGEQLQHLTGHTSCGATASRGPPTAPASPAPATTDSVRIWDPATGEQLQHLTGHTDWVSSVAWSPDSTRLASAGNDGSVRIWDPATGEQLQHLTGHTGGVDQRRVVPRRHPPRQRRQRRQRADLGPADRRASCTTSPATPAG